MTKANGGLAWPCCCRPPWWPGLRCFPWPSSPTPRWPRWFLHLPSPSFLSLWSPRTVPCSASPSINRPFCPNSVSSDKPMCTELSVVDHGLTLKSLRDDQLSHDIAHEASSALISKARRTTNECKNHACFALTYRPQTLSSLSPVLSAS